MKLRDGFVSNSSSSSFIMGVRKGLELKDAFKDLSDKANTSNVLFAETVVRLYDVLKRNARLASLKELAEMVEDDGRGWGPNSNIAIELAKKGLAGEVTVYTGSAEDQSYNSYENLLCELAIDYKSEDLIIFKEAGY